MMILFEIIIILVLVLAVLLVIMLIIEPIFKRKVLTVTVKSKSNINQAEIQQLATEITDRLKVIDVLKLSDVIVNVEFEHLIEFNI